MHSAMRSVSIENLELTDYALALLKALNFTSFFLWALTNCTLLLLLYLLRRHIFTPMQGILTQMRNMLGSDTEKMVDPMPSMISMRTIAGDVTRMTQLARIYYQQHQEASHALGEVRSALSQILGQQHTIMTHTSREMLSQYQSVLTYANYLEEQIARHAIDPALRYDFDEVSESSFNLKLIAGALSLIQQADYAPPVAMNIPELLEHTMLALSASLDRRCMKLTTVEVDLAVMARSDPSIIIHVLWMLLLGTIRYAADESTLRLRCFYNREQTRAMISIVVSELSPGRMTEEERSVFMARQLQHLTPHMFAETIRIHANMQLAELLLLPLDAQISILPLTSYSCEICLTLPAATTA